MLRKIRITLALVCFIGITLLLLDFTGTLRGYLSWLPSIQFVPAVLALHFIIVAALLLGTLILGRVYCSVICPLGVMQDCISRLRSLFDGKKSSMRFGYKAPATWLRVTMLVAFVVLMLAGLTSLAALIEPYSEYGRIVMSILAPLYDSANNLAADLSADADSTLFYTSPRSLPLAWPVALVGIVTLLVVGIMAWISGRLYCNTICPVGTLLGFLSRYSWLKPVIDTSKCNGCKSCARKCKASCIDAENHSIDYSRCVSCMDCIDNCRQGAISYTHRPCKSSKPVSIDTDRRKMLAITTAVAGASAVKALGKTVDGGLAPLSPKESPRRSTPIAPPGAVSLKNFSQHCVACQLCVSECPNKVLRPSVELENFMQPVVSYEDGYCRPECTACSQVCPAGAIKPISREEKATIQVGHAIVNTEACLAAQGVASCGNCARHCPAGAIMMIPTDGRENAEKPVRMPAVNEAICIGCGACENLCPVTPVSAITVDGHEIHRHV